MVLNFWTTWCGPCRFEVPALVRLRQDFRPEQVAIVGISVDDRGTPQRLVPLIERFVEQFEINYPVYHDMQQKVAGRYGQYGDRLAVVPTTVVIDQQGRAFGHAPRPAARTETPALAAEGNQMLDVAALATYPQEAMFQPTAFEVILEFPLDITRQYRALVRQMGGKHRVMLLDNLIEKCLFGLVALVTVSAQSRTGTPCRSVVGHDPRPCDTVLA